MFQRTTKLLKSSFRTFGTTPEFILVEKIDKVQLIRLNKPKAFNSLCSQIFSELLVALRTADANPEISSIVLTGNKKAFAAGADIKEMEQKTFAEVTNANYLMNWEDISLIRKPIIAAVNGYALGGGCELAMMCDIILAGDSAQFGQPEIKIGTIPGGGGSQRLIRAIGKSRAMELILTGEFMSAAEAKERGLVSRVEPADKLVDEAVNLAKKISEFSKPLVALAKESVNAAYEFNLKAGLLYEKRVFHSTFALEDKREGMEAFGNRRAPVFKNS